jgi:hypothetical protein
VVSGAAYFLPDAGNASTDSAAADGVSWAQIVFGVLFLLLAGRSWRNRPARELSDCWWPLVRPVLARIPRLGLHPLGVMSQTRKGP